MKNVANRSTTPIVSCVVNGHKEGQILHHSLVSVQRARAYAAECGIDTELLLVLDCPDSDTLAIAQGLASDEAQIEYVKFGDLADSRNHAVSVARGRYTAFLDGDDLWCRSWLVDCLLTAKAHPERALILHPEFNVIFGNDESHVFQHVDMDSREFDLEYLYFMNYWTALSFAETDTYRQQPFRRNCILDGFGFEDWTWNMETIRSGFVHKVVPATSHYIRKAKPGESLLEQTNSLRAVPRIFELYRLDDNQEAFDAHQAVQSVVGGHAGVARTGTPAPAALKTDNPRAMLDDLNLHTVDVGTGRGDWQ